MGKLINKIQSLLPKGQKQTITKKEKATFEVSFETLKVGYLSLDDGLWTFRYAEEFKKQTRVNILTDFPNVESEYKITELWPFFAVRIPGLKQPKIQAIIRKKNLDEGNQAMLLKEFGEKTIANPFLLTAQ